MLVRSLFMRRKFLSFFLLALWFVLNSGGRAQQRVISNLFRQPSDGAGSAIASSQAFVDWARAHAIALKTVEAGNGFDDMQRLGPIVGDARIVALGEATHGTHEFFQFKHRMLEFLSTQKGFTIFSIEANMPEAYRLNDYVLHGTGDPKALLKGMYFWTWNTQEVLAMIEWMRQFNQSGKGHVEFTGFDMQTPTVSIEIVRTFLEAHQPSYLDAVNPIYAQIASKASGGRAFGLGTASFPLGVAAGKHINYSGYIKSDGVTEGWSGLWWRVDGDAAKILAFDNMQGRGITGTTPWTRYEISIDVPANARKINFGVLHPGNGTVWFDSLQVEVDGVPYADHNAFDLDFESETPRGFYAGGEGYEVVIDKAVAHTGKQSLRSRSVEAHGTTENSADLQMHAATICRYLEDERAWLTKQADAHEVDWIIQNARLVEQYTRLKGNVNARDEAMAENVKWIVDHNPGAKVVVWAHNGHVGRGPNESFRPMGSYLSKWFGKDYVTFGFAFNEGSFRSREMGKDLREFTVGSAPDGSLDRALASTGIPILALDLRQLPTQGAVAEWLDQPHLTRSIGAIYSDQSPDNYFSNQRPQGAYDVLLFVAKTSAARGN